MKRLAIAAGLAVLVMAAGAPRSANAGGVEVELNRLEPAAANCRLYLVFKNGAGRALDALKLDLVVFDRDGIVARQIVLNGGAMPAGKTSLKLFDIEELGCQEFGRLLLNDVVACEPGLPRPADCLAALAVSSRTAVEFVK